MKKVKSKSSNNEYITQGYFEAHLDMRFRLFREDLVEEYREQTAKVLQAVDKVVTRFDAAEKDRAAHSSLHKRITDDILDHGKRIRTLEEVKKWIEPFKPLAFLFLKDWILSDSIAHPHT